eukprot:Pompholyxophrys_punicea_v1_NODE_751_length_1348_cov_4.706110.p4 type:complete len:120 gc:universal NODE_751_length_1348_cov_4.706110:1139-780(-)
MYFCLVDSMSVLFTVVFKIFSHMKTSHHHHPCQQMNNFGLVRSRIYWNVLIPHCKASRVKTLNPRMAFLPSYSMALFFCIYSTLLLLLHLMTMLLACLFRFFLVSSNAQRELMLFGIAI